MKPKNVLLSKWVASPVCKSIVSTFLLMGIDETQPFQAQTTEGEDDQGTACYSNVAGITTSGSTGPLVFPNPASSGVILKTADPALLNNTVGLLDLNGRVVGQQKITGRQQYIDLHALTAGIYFLQLANDTTIKVVKII